MDIFVSLLHPDSNSELRIYMLALFDELLGLKEFTEGLVQKAWKIMEAIILPNLVWRVGRVASSIRKNDTQSSSEYSISQSY